MQTGKKQTGEADSQVEKRQTIRKERYTFIGGKTDLQAQERDTQINRKTECQTG